MTKNIIISAIAILTLNFGFAQTFQTQVGPSFKKESEKDIYKKLLSLNLNIIIN